MRWEKLWAHGKTLQGMVGVKIKQKQRWEKDVPLLLVLLAISSATSRTAEGFATEYTTSASQFSLFLCAVLAFLVRHVHNAIFANRLQRRHVVVRENTQLGG